MSVDRRVGIVELCACIVQADVYCRKTKNSFVSCPSWCLQTTHREARTLSEHLPSAGSACCSEYMPQPRRPQLLLLGLVPGALMQAAPDLQLQISLQTDVPTGLKIQSSGMSIECRTVYCDSSSQGAAPLQPSTAPKVILCCHLLT